MKKRIYEYDIVRTIATYSVIIVHITAIAMGGYETFSPHSVITIFVNRLLKYTTPVFIYLAGALIYETYKNKPFNYKNFLISRSKRILIPYTIVSLMYYLILTYMSQGMLSGSAFIKQLITGSAQYHLYFIPIIIQLYLLTPIFLFLKNRVNLKMLMPVLVVVSYVSTIMMKFTYSDRIFLKFMVPYTLGIYFGSELLNYIKSLEKRISVIILGTIGVGAFYAYSFMQYYYQKPSSEVFRDSGWFIYCILSCVALTWGGMQLVKKDSVKKNCSYISKISYYIYLLHPLFIAVSERILNRMGILSTTFRLGFDLIFVIAISTVVAHIVFKALKWNVYKKMRGLSAAKQAVIISLTLIAGGTLLVLSYNNLVEKGYIVSFESRLEARELNNLHKSYKKSSLVYKNPQYGFNYYYDGFEKNDENEWIQTTFTNNHTSVDVYYENLEGTVHTSKTFTIYGNKNIVDGEYVSVSRDEFISYEDFQVHLIVWSRPTLKYIESDKNYYGSIDIIKNNIEVYNISIRSDEPFEIDDYLARFEITDINPNATVKRISYERSKNLKWNILTSSYYEEKFIENEELDWGFFEPTSIHGLETVLDIEKRVSYDFKYLLQYYNLNSYISKSNIDDIYDAGKILEFTLQTSVYGEFDSDVIMKILDGVYDEEFDIIVESISNISGPVLFRLNNEMNGDWCTYNAYFFQKDTSIYNELWRYIYNKFEEKGAENIIWIWNPNELGFPNFKWNHYTNYFPGEQYVDIIGVTGYNTGDFYDGETWRTFESIYDEFMSEYETIFVNYPFMITEFGSSTFGGNKAEWMEDMMQVINKYGFKVAIYWNSIDYAPEKEKARIYKFDDDPVIVEIFKRHLEGK